MRVLISTSGVLNPAATVDLCRRLLDEERAVTVMTVIEVPRTFLDSMDDEERRSFLDDTPWESSTAEVKALGYLEERGRRVVEPLVVALRGIGVEPDTRFVESADPVMAIVGTANAISAGAVIMGATRRLFTEQAWMSVSARVMEQIRCPLILVPPARTDEPTD